MFASPLAAETTLSEDAKACLKAVGRELSKRPALRSVTVAARLPDAQRVGGAGLAIARRAADALVGGGIKGWQVSAVAPASHPGEPAALRIAFREKRSTRPVARLQAISGVVEVGSKVAELQPGVRGSLLLASQFVRTGARSHARLLLADGSLVRLRAGSLLRLGKVELTRELDRSVRLELHRGKLETVVRAHGLRSVFNVLTRSAVAGVRGTDFRVASDGKEATRVETLDGSVELASALDSVGIAAGRGSRVGSDGLTEQTRALLAAPAVRRLKVGKANAKARMRWSAVPNAGRYLVELARDAEFSRDVRERQMRATMCPVGADLGAGKWFWRVTAVDSDGFVGLPSKVYSFVLKK